jgi:hypothetical protein
VNTLDAWTEAVCAELGLDAGAVDPKALLDVARDVAHAVARPAAPLTAYLLGLAVGRGLPAAEASARVGQLAAAWGARAGSIDETDGPAR